jgi:hypothetical protein
MGVGCTEGPLHQPAKQQQKGNINAGYILRMLIQLTIRTFCTMSRVIMDTIMDWPSTNYSYYNTSTVELAWQKIATWNEIHNC